MIRVLRRVWGVLLWAMAWAARLVLLVVLLRYSSPPPNDRIGAITLLAGDALFDYAGWMATALLAKTEQTLYGVHPFMSEDERSTFVRRYMDDLTRVNTLNGQIDTLYADPQVGDPARATAELRAERDALRADLASRQSLAEAILEGQVAAVLVEQGFDVGGQLLPPIAMRFSAVPNMLITSPRDTIQFEYGYPLDPLPADAQAAIETRVEAAQDVSALVVPLGGIALYPAMILERTSIPASLDTFAHEWLHHYLLLFPLGFAYEFGNETRIINETTAVLFGREVSRLVVARYYPDLLPPTMQDMRTFARRADALLFAPLQPAPFDYGREMNETRVTVDGLLAAGLVETAERYMETRRRQFVANGYLIRRINQAFFAFYGGYQTGAPGAGGSDPIGPAVQRIRDYSASIYDWIVTMRNITTREELLTASGDA
jgi:hypothetical protein